MDNSDHEPMTTYEAMILSIPRWAANLQDAVSGETGPPIGLPAFTDTDGMRKLLIITEGAVKKRAVNEEQIRRARLDAAHGGLPGILLALEAELKDGVYLHQELDELCAAHDLVERVWGRTPEDREALIQSYIQRRSVN